MAKTTTGRFPAPGTGLPYLLFRTTPRDRWLLAMLHEHQALTAEHITHLCYGTLRGANRRLAALAELGVLDRTRVSSFRTWSPYLYTLAPAGALIVGAERDQSVKELRYDRAKLLRQAARPDLPHTLGCNSLMIHLAVAHRIQSAAPRLAVWWGPVSCLRLWGDAIRPDAYGVLDDPRAAGREHGSCGFFLEYDTGSESGIQLAAKIRGYARYAENYTGHRPVLVQVPNATREARLHARITETYGTSPVPIATSIATLDPADASWAVHGGGARVPIAALPTVFTARGYRLLPPILADPTAPAPAPTWD